MWPPPCTKDTGVTVTPLMPGPTETDFFRRADMQNNKEDRALVARHGTDGSYRNREHGYQLDSL
jgi:short-subunit dehydrogenase